MKPNLIFLCYTLAVLTCSAGQGHPSTPVILISVDTLRADRLSCYQPGRRLTPNIDSLTKSGTLFSDVSSTVPLTLPSHVALFTSTYPFVNDVQDNGVPLGAGRPTLTTALRNCGYRTAAFVGSFVLDRRFGLSRDFDVYDSPFDLRKQSTTDASDLKRPGSQVAASAMRWLDANSRAPFFLFLHFYDLHTPYDLPQSDRARSEEAGYEGELAYVDRVLGGFLKYLEANDILGRSLIVFTSDHGEGLGDHGESTHGYFVYQSTLHVPLIIHWPKNAKRIAESRVDQPASLLDIGPTILDALGIPSPKEMQGRSLMKPKDGEQIYSESLYAEKHFGCAPLRSLRVQRYKYIEAPEPELYDLKNDPGELQNIYQQRRSTAAALQARIEALRANSGAARSDSSERPDATATAALRSLGYLSGAPSRRDQSHIDPKNRIVQFEEFGRASALASAGRLAGSTEMLKKLHQELPDVQDISITLGLNQERGNQYTAAAHTFERAVEQDPLNARAHFDLALCLYRLKEPGNAIRELRAALVLEPWYTRAEELLAEIYLAAHNYVQARTDLEHLLSIDPDNYTAHYDLAVLAAMQQNWTEAQQNILAALRTDSGSAEAHNMLGSIYLRSGELDKAQAELEQAIHLQWNFVSAHYNLALVLENKGEKDMAADELKTSLKIDPQFAAARKELEALVR